MPAEYAFDEAEYATRVTAGEQDREPGHDHREERSDLQEEQHDVVRDGQQPFDQRQPPVHVAGGVRVGVVEADRLVIVGGGVLVVHQGQVDQHPVGEPLQFEVPVEPPARVLLPEHDHEQRAEEQQAARAGRGPGGPVAVAPLPGPAGHRAQDDRDGDDREDAENAGHAVKLPVGVVDREADRVRGPVHCHASFAGTPSGTIVPVFRGTAMPQYALPRAGLPQPPARSRRGPHRNLAGPLHGPGPPGITVRRARRKRSSGHVRSPRGRSGRPEAMLVDSAAPVRLVAAAGAYEIFTRIRLRG